MSCAFCHVGPNPIKPSANADALKEELGLCDEDKRGLMELLKTF